VSENFDFKTSIKDLDIHICAMANTSGGYLVLGVDEHKSGDHLLGFKLIGFDVGIQIRNEMVKIEPYPDVAIKNVEDDNKKKFYPILKIEFDDFKKPYFTRGICYVRLGPSSTRASRTTILNLFTNLSVRREK
jgi:predicted HTH transcriptional regulator